MNIALKLVKMGNSTAFVVPKELRERLRVELGDVVYATDGPDGVRLTPFKPDFEAKMKLAEKIMREDRDILRVLAQ
jgi:putative addiction module antidote